MTSPKVSVTILVDDQGREGFTVEHGFSAWIETEEVRILFDAGQTAAFALNAAKLNIALEKTDAVVLSHGHYDHTGGLREAISLMDKPRIFFHPAALQARYNRRDSPPHPMIGMPRDSISSLKNKSVSVSMRTKSCYVAQDVGLTGVIPRRNGFEKSEGRFFLDFECTIPDPIADDQALWVRAQQGIVVLLGCAHSGVVNTLDWIAELTGVSTFHAVIGGMHLGHADSVRLETTADALSRYGIEWLAPCHCTGGKAMQFFHHRFPGRVAFCGTGTRMTL